jgi:hypothetical protein
MIRPDLAMIYLTIYNKSLPNQQENFLFNPILFRKHPSISELTYDQYLKKVLVWFCYQVRKSVNVTGKNFGVASEM